MSPSSSPSFPFSPCVIYIRRRSSLVGMTARQTWKGLPHATQAAGQSRPVERRHVGMVGECPAKKETRPAWRMERLFFIPPLCFFPLSPMSLSCPLCPFPQPPWPFFVNNRENFRLFPKFSPGILARCRESPYLCTRFCERRPTGRAGRGEESDL